MTNAEKEMVRELSPTSKVTLSVILYMFCALIEIQERCSQNKNTNN